jgi:acyl-CoA synthetase (AMP-forming)/AMP-acid ligase II
LAKQWQEAAPNSVIENLYGPTETTIAISHYRWDNVTSPDRCRNGIVPIGEIFKGQTCCIIDEKLNVLPPGEKGELCLSGSQVTQGYLNNIEKTRMQYINIPAFGDRIWYKTGDLALQDEEGCVYYLGRVDNQVKILGYRVELQEIDAVLRKASGSEMAVSVAWPISDGSAQGIVGFICGGNTTNKDEILSYCSLFLPKYMMPSAIFFVENMPLNANGKINRNDLIKKLEEKA